jgi:hypothetical protein
MSDTPQISCLDLASLNAIVRTTIDALPVNPDATPEERADLRRAVLLAIAELGPSNRWEAMFAAQATTAHYAMMEAFRRAALPDLPNAEVIRLHGTALSLARQSMVSLRELRQVQAAVATRSASPQFQAEAARHADPAPSAAPPAASRTPSPAPPVASKPTTGEPDAVYRKNPLLGEPPAASAIAIPRPAAVVTSPVLPPLSPEPLRSAALAPMTAQQGMQTRILTGVTRDLHQRSAAAGVGAR